MLFDLEKSFLLSRDYGTVSHVILSRLEGKENQPMGRKTLPKPA
jgi:hypothetical protein